MVYPVSPYDNRTIVPGQGSFLLRAVIRKGNRILLLVLGDDVSGRKMNLPNPGDTIRFWRR